MTASILDRRQVLVAGATLLIGVEPSAAHDGTVHVMMEKLVFLPAEIEMKVGQTIEWINKDPFAHTATVKGGWEVMIPPGKAATHVVAAGDTVEYYCRFHPNMKGRIKVST
jgi:plastocyanin